MDLDRQISFRLRTDDNPRTSGVFADKVRIGLPPNDFVELKEPGLVLEEEAIPKGRIKEKEVITGSAVFEAGENILSKHLDHQEQQGSVLRTVGTPLSMMTILIMDLMKCRPFYH